MKRSKRILSVRNFLFLLVVALVVALIVIRVFTSKSSTSNSAGQRGYGAASVAVQTAEVTYGPVKQNREFTGTVKAAYSYVVAAKVSGRLSKLSKRIGARTGTDEAVGKIDDTEYRQAVLEARAQADVSRASVKESEAQLDYAEKEMQRIKELVEKGVSSRAELDAIQTQHATQKSRVDLSRAQLAQREASLAQAQTRLDYTTIRSAQPGYVAVRHTDGGALLSVNSPVLTIVGIDTVYVEISVPERDYPLITAGQKTSINVEALPGREFTGKVSSVSPLFHTATRTAVVEVAVMNDSLLLKPGMFARIIVTLAEKDSAQIVPITAIVNRDGRDAVFVPDDSGKVKLMTVVTGIIDGNKAEVLSPRLHEVITMGNHLLTDGAMITIGVKSGKVPGEAKK